MRSAQHVFVWSPPAGVGYLLDEATLAGVAALLLGVAAIVAGVAFLGGGDKLGGFAVLIACPAVAFAGLSGSSVGEPVFGIAGLLLMGIGGST